MPKAEDPKSVEVLDRAGAQHLLLLIKSAVGFGALEALSNASARVIGFALGTSDLALDLGLVAIDDPDASELIWQRRVGLVVESRRLGKRVPIDGVPFLARRGFPHAFT